MSGLVCIWNNCWFCCWLTQSKHIDEANKSNKQGNSVGWIKWYPTLPSHWPNELPHVDGWRPIAPIKTLRSVLQEKEAALSIFDFFQFKYSVQASEKAVMKENHDICLVCFDDQQFHFRLNSDRGFCVLWGLPSTRKTHRIINCHCSTFQVAISLFQSWSSLQYRSTSSNRFLKASIK